jgi:beta-phosphoglucomutase
VTDILLLDYNGVIVDDEPVHYAALREALADTGVAVDEQWYFAELLGLDDRAGIRRAFRNAGRPLDPGSLARLAAAKARRYAEHVRDDLPLVPGVARFARAASAVARIGVVSGALREEIADGLARAGIADLVAAVVGAEDVHAGKPDPEGHLLAIAALTRGSAPPRVLVMEDSVPGLAAARSLGAGCVALSTSRPGAALADADAVWASFEGHTPAELTPLFRRIAIRAGA